jgi:uncharacterized membrane protein YdjX (TVP38/TMEM64 family)
MSALMRHWQLTLFVVLAGLVALFYASGASAYFPDLSRENIDLMVERAGLWGPALIVGLMVLAVVASPIPSAPIALVAGAAYGHVQGAILVLLGAEVGAIIAFVLARLLGRETVQRLLGERINMGLLGSQNVLMLTVFASRLMPFISFDMVSYGAGLSPLTFWRFAVATMVGIIPASFVLAHLGVRVVDNPTGVGGILILGLGLVTGAPLLLMLFGWKPRSMRDGAGSHTNQQDERDTAGQTRADDGKRPLGD